jgi:hypothetical protein
MATPAPVISQRRGLNAASKSMQAVSGTTKNNLTDFVVTQADQQILAQRGDSLRES